MCGRWPAFTIAPMGDSPGGPTANFTHHFLIAMPTMADPRFSQTLTYVCEHNENGALGIVVNKPTEMSAPAREAVAAGKALYVKELDGAPLVWVFGGTAKTANGERKTGND